jgi:hypothetical protein
VIPFQETLIIGIGKPGKPGFADVFFSEFQIHPWGIYFGGPAKPRTITSLFLRLVHYSGDRPVDVLTNPNM